MTMRTLVPAILATMTLAGCVVAPPPNGTGSAAVGGGSMEAVVSRTFTAYGFELESGAQLPDMTRAFETYGTLARTPGWCGGLIGPGKTIDTTRYFVVASNMLGSSYGSTAPASSRRRASTRNTSRSTPTSPTARAALTGGSGPPPSRSS